MLATLAALLTFGAGPAGAVDVNCRASVLRAQVLIPIEPLIANGLPGGIDRPACAAETVGLPALDVAGVHAELLSAATTKAPLAKASAAVVTASAPGLAVAATAVYSVARADCVAGHTKFSGSSGLASLTVNGQAVDVRDGLAQVGTSLVQIVIDEHVVSATGLTVRAARVTLLDGSAVALILAESRVSGPADACGGGSGGGSGGGGGGSGGGGGGSGGGGGGSGGGGVGSGGGGVVDAAHSPGRVVNGRNGNGCGHLKMWVWKVDDRGHPLSGRRHTATSRFGNRVVLRGRLISCKGHGITDAQLDQIHVLGHHRVLAKNGVRTRGRGKVTVILPNNTTTRTIRLVYRGNLASRRRTSSVRLHLRVINAHGHVVHRQPG